MRRILASFKVLFFVAVDFLAIETLFQDPYIALIATTAITAYVIWGGYLGLLTDSAVRSKDLPSYQKNRLEMAKAQLVEDVRIESGSNLARLKIFIVPGDRSLNATAYGCNCVSVTRGTLENSDPMTLNAVLAHEISHTLNFDPECSRAVFCTVTLLLGALSVMSFAAVAIVFIVFLICGFLSSYLGFWAYHGTSKAVTGIFTLLQNIVVITYKTLLGVASRQAEYRSDAYACKLGYGIQLSYFLTMAEPTSHRQFTLTEALYRSHPPTPKRLARIEQQLLAQKNGE